MEPMLRTLFVHTPGTRLVLDGQSVKALRDDAPPRRLPLEAIDTLVVASGVDVSTPLLIYCAEQQRIVAFVSRNGKPRALVEGPMNGRAEVRRRQFAAHADEYRRADLARTVVLGKVRQMAWALRQWARDAEGTSRDELRDTAGKLDDVASGHLMRSCERESLLGMEGEATRRYFGALHLVLRNATWGGRSRRPALDPINATLSWLYGMTRISVSGAIMVAGLDPGTGYLHGDRAGQPSLVLDLMEELRPAADRVAVRLWNTKRLQPKHFDRGLAGAVELGLEGRQILLDEWHAHRMAEVHVRGRVDPIPNGFIPIMQAHAMANALRHNESYEPHARAVR